MKPIEGSNPSPSANGPRRGETQKKPEEEGAGPRTKDEVERVIPGEMAERLKAHAWKACVLKGTVGSNPTLSAIQSAVAETSGA